jgi:acetylornithine deacetylase/succinyl-diaminopimelate desuccinylase-like protein
MRVPGRAAHHAMWEQGKSALDNAIALKDALVDWERLRAAETRHDPWFGEAARDLHPRAVHADTVWYLRAGDPDIMATPTEAELAFWVDHLPGEDREGMLQRFEAHVLARAAAHPWLRDHPPVLERAIMRPFTGISVPADAPIVRSLGRASEATTGRPARVVGLEGATDAMIFHMYTDIPDVVRSTQALALAILDFCGVAP